MQAKASDSASQKEEALANSLAHLADSLVCCCCFVSIHWEIKGRFRKRAVLANVPSFRFSFRGNIRRNRPFGNHPFVNTKKGHWEIKGRFQKGGFGKGTLVPVFVPGEHPPKLLETTLLRTPDPCLFFLRLAFSLCALSLSIYLSIYLSVCLSVCLSICLSIYIYIYIYICWRVISLSTFWPPESY